MSADPEVLRGLASVLEIRLASALDIAERHEVERSKFWFTAGEMGVLLDALRAPQNDGAAAMRESIARWHNEVADDRQERTALIGSRRPGSDAHALMDRERMIHRDAARAVRSMPLPPALSQPDPRQEPGTGGERA